MRIQLIVVASLTTSLGALGHALALQHEIQRALPQARVLPPFNTGPEGYESLKKTLMQGNKKEDRFLIISIGEAGIAAFNQILADKDIPQNTLALIWGGHQYLPELDPLMGKLAIMGLPLHESAQIEAKLKHSNTRLVSAMGVPNDFTPDNLRINLERYRANIEAMIGKKTACIGVFLGGPAPDRQKQTHDFTAECAGKLGEYIKSIAEKKDAAVIISAGARTPQEALKEFVLPFENSGLTYQVVDANTKGFSYGLLAFLKEMALLPFPEKLKASEAYVTFDSITMGTAAIETQALGNVTAVGIDSMSESHLAFADLAYKQGLVSYLKWDNKNQSYEYLPRLKEKENEAGNPFMGESTATISAKEIVKALFDLHFFTPSQDKIAT